MVTKITTWKNDANRLEASAAYVKFEAAVLFLFAVVVLFVLVEFPVPVVLLVPLVLVVLVDEPSVPLPEELPLVEDVEPPLDKLAALVSEQLGA